MMRTGRRGRIASAMRFFCLGGAARGTPRRLPRAVPAALAALVLLLACLSAADAAEQWRVRRFTIRGNRAVHTSDIRSTITTRVPSRFAFLPFVPLPPFDNAAFAADLQRIRDLYRSRGFYGARVDNRISRDEKKRTVTIVVTISEGQPVLISSVKIEYEEPVEPEVETGIPVLFAMRTGRQFTVDNYQTAKSTLQTYLRNNGYASASVTGEVIIHTTTNSAEVAFLADAGRRNYFGPTSIRGNATIRDEYLLRELAYDKGDPFSQQKLYNSQRRIFRLDLFDSVVITPEIRENEAEVPINIDVTERKKRTLNLGLGYGVEDRLRAQAVWRKRYLFGEPRTLSLSLRYSSILWSGALDIAQDYFLDASSNLDVRVGYDREILVSYSNERISSQTRVGRNFSPSVDGFLTYNLEINRPTGVDPATVRSLQETRSGDYYFISSVLLGAKLDTVPDKANPRKGSVISLTFEDASNLLGSKLDYFRGIAELRDYEKVPYGPVVATRLQFGFIVPYRYTKDIPIFKRFFTGGSTSVRGYSFQMVGPLDPSGHPLGGQYLLEGNLELRFPVAGKFGGVTFLDAGNVYQDRSSFDPNDLRYGTGLGARYDTLIGPVRLDVAFPFGKVSEIAVANYQVYFSLGNAF